MDGSRSGSEDEDLKELLHELEKRQEKEMTDLRRRQWLEAKDSGATARRRERDEEEQNDMLQDFEQTTERYLGTKQDLVHAPNDGINLTLP